MPKQDKWLSLQEAAVITGYDDSSLRRLAKEGIFPAEKIGGTRWAVNESKLRRWMASEHYHPGEGRPRKER